MHVFYEKHRVDSNTIERKRLKMRKTYDRLAVGERIREKRILLGFTQEELSERIDRAPKYCADIQRGACGMSVETMLALCEVLNMSLDYLIFGKTPEAEKASQTKEVTAIMDMLNQCSEAKRFYAMELLKLYLKSSEIQ